MLEVSHVRKAFSSVVAVQDVSFEAHRGEILGLIGPNGAGKTTTIRMILNILKPDSGNIAYMSRPFEEQLMNQFGYLPEERGLYRKSRVLDTMKYFGELKGMDRSAAGDAAAFWLDNMGVREFAQRRIDELSKGNQQKIQFAVALMHDPWLVILDEPFSGLDPINQELLKRILLDLKKKQKAVIFSTHQMEQAEQLSDRLCLINRGKTVLQGTLPEIKRRYGRNLVSVEFSGDGAFLATLNGVSGIRLFPHAAEIELSAGHSAGQLLRQIIDRVDVRSYRLVEPSLQSIFMEVVGGKLEGAGT